MIGSEYVAYYRVSTDKQGRSGLGLDAQRASVAALCAQSVVAEFVEVESGRRDDRPQLEAAIAEARKRKAVLVVAKLDRLSRRVSFVARLMDSGVDFVAADMPHANRLTIHVLAAVAEHERDMISQRTKDALAAAKARGKRLGNPRPHESLLRAREARSRDSRAWARGLKPIVDGLRAAGATGPEALARGLNAAGVVTRTGSSWHRASVQRLLARID